MPILEDVAAAVAGKAKVVKVDTDALGGLAQRFDISSIPTLIVFKDGQKVNHFLGLQDAATLLKALQ